MISNFGSFPFIEGWPPSKNEPLSRYLPAVDDGIISGWLGKNVPPGSWILDPFCASPKIAIEASHAGYKVLVTVNNPITRFILEMMADPPSPKDLKSALAALSSAYVSNERLEPHIRSLYNTTCSRCGYNLSAEAYLWVHGTPTPCTRIYTCPNCGDTGERPCTAADVEYANKFSATGLHKARALERVVASTDPDREHVEQALSVYSPRALYALITVINKIGGLDISLSAKKCLSALLLFAFDQSNAMWKGPGQKEKPRQLSIPRNYRENNVWLALEEGVTAWSAVDDEKTPRIPLVTWPALPPAAGGICIYEGRFASIAESVKDLYIKAVCTALPRPNQAYWTLSALWAGWLWGREAIAHFKSVLHRQRYDWAWHTNALASVFKQLVLTLEQSTPMFGVINDLEPGFLISAIVASGLEGGHLENIALRPEEGQAQITWRLTKASEINQTESEYSLSAAQSSRRYLELRGEPASYLPVLAAGLTGILASWGAEPMALPALTDTPQSPNPGTDQSNSVPEQQPSITYASVNNAVREALSYRCGYLQFGLQDVPTFEQPEKSQATQEALFTPDSKINLNERDESESDESEAESNPLELDKEKPSRPADIPISTIIWLREPDIVNETPVTDRCELSLVQYLIEHPGGSFQDIDSHICQQFPGLLTPSTELIRICLESYAKNSPGSGNQWYIREEDKTRERQADQERAEQIIFTLGNQSRFICDYQATAHSKRFIKWLDPVDGLEYRFFITSSAAIADVVLYGDLPKTRTYVVIPGSRANIIFYKLRRDPRLGKAFNPSTGSWRFLKFRHLRSLAESPGLTKENLEMLLDLDPLTYSAPQLWLI